MEYSIRMVVVVLIVLVVATVCIALITSWGGQSSSMIGSLFKFFEGIMGGGKGAQLPSLPAGVK